MDIEDLKGPMLSVIICTYNRSESLKRTLKSIYDMSVPKDLMWEILIVDNNSSDDTQDVVKAFAMESGLNVKYFFENEQGLSCARNRGIKEAGGEIIVFTDDDTVVDKYWLNNIVKAFRKNNPACIGGKILPLWETTPPKWLKIELFATLAILDLGDEQRELSNPNIYGANFAVNSSMFQKYGNFDTNMGRTAGKLYTGEESELVRILIDKGEMVLYCPDIVVYHFIPASRMIKSYFRKWEYDRSELKGIQMGKCRYKSIKGIPLYAIGNVFKGFIKWLLLQFIASENAFSEELWLTGNIGFIAGRIKYRELMKVQRTKNA